MKWWWISLLFFKIAQYIMDLEDNKCIIYTNSPMWWGNVIPQWLLHQPWCCQVSSLWSIVWDSPHPSSWRVSSGGSSRGCPLISSWRRLFWLGDLDFQHSSQICLSSHPQPATCPTLLKGVHLYSTNPACLALLQTPRCSIWELIYNRWSCKASTSKCVNTIVRPGNYLAFSLELM